MSLDDMSEGGERLLLAAFRAALPRYPISKLPMYSDEEEATNAIWNLRTYIAALERTVAAIPGIEASAANRVYEAGCGVSPEEAWKIFKTKGYDGWPPSFYNKMLRVCGITLLPVAGDPTATTTHPNVTSPALSILKAND